VKGFVQDRDFQPQLGLELSRALRMRSEPDRATFAV